MAGSSKNNPDARRVEGWRCNKCGTPNPPQANVCRGKTSSRLLAPNPSGRGMRTTMEHTPCGATRAA